MVNYRKLAAIGAALAVLTLAGCHKCPAVVTTDPIIITDIPATTTVSETTGMSETTAVVATTSPIEPSKTVVNIPGVVSEQQYTKEAVDIMENGSIDFTHSVNYPRIDSKKPGAVALNAKIAEPYKKIIQELQDGNEGRMLYKVGYNYSVEDNFLFIRMNTYTGYQYSEGGYSQAIFYYDVANDREVTVDEYLSHFGIDKEKAKQGALWSDDLIKAGYGKDICAAATLGGEPMGGPAPNEIFYRCYSDFDDSVTLDGVEVTADEVRLYYRGTAYITNTFKCTLQRETLLPIRPHYAGYVMPQNEPESSTVNIIFENNKVAELSCPAELEIYAVAFSSAEITVRAYKPMTNATISLNGCAPYTTSASSYSTDQTAYAYTFRIYDYIPMDEFKTIRIACDETAEVSDIPAVIAAEIYRRTAIDIFTGGEMDFVHSVTYPKIDSDKPGAEALNAKIAAEYAPIIEKLRSGDEGRMYNMFFDDSECDGIITLCIYNNIGRQGTEGGCHQQLFYFDTKNDRELTMDEYLAYFSVDLDKAKNGALWSYTYETDTYPPVYVYSETVGKETTTEIPVANQVCYKRPNDFGRSITLDGVAVSENTVKLYFNAYTASQFTFSCVLDRATLLPADPNFVCKMDTWNIKDGEIRITFENGKITSALCPENAGITDMVISASDIEFKSTLHFDKGTCMINDEKWGDICSSSYNEDTGIYSYHFSALPENYIPLSTLKTITIQTAK